MSPVAGDEPDSTPDVQGESQSRICTEGRVPTGKINLSSAEMCHAGTGGETSSPRFSDKSSNHGLIVVIDDSEACSDADHGFFAVKERWHCHDVVTFAIAGGLRSEASTIPVQCVK